MDTNAASLLRISGLVTGYGKRQVLNGVDVEVSAGEIVALIGHNGAGKSTLLKAVFGLLKVWSGQVIYDGASLDGAQPRDLLRRGMAYVPQVSPVTSKPATGGRFKTSQCWVPYRGLSWWRASAIG